MSATSVGWVGVAIGAAGIVLLSAFRPDCTDPDAKMSRWQIRVVGTVFAIAALVIGTSTIGLLA